MNETHPLGEASEPLAGEGQRAFVSIDANQTEVASRLQKTLGVAAKADRTVHDDWRIDIAQKLDHFIPQDGDVHLTHERSGSAACLRATSS